MYIIYNIYIYIYTYLAVVDQETLDSVTPTLTLDSMRPGLSRTSFTLMFVYPTSRLDRSFCKFNMRIIVFRWYFRVLPLVSLGSCPEILKSPRLTFIPAPVLSVSRVSRVSRGAAAASDVEDTGHREAQGGIKKYHDLDIGFEVSTWKRLKQIGALPYSWRLAAYLCSGLINL